MKNICIVSGTFTEYQVLHPLVKEIQKDKSMSLTVISRGRHEGSDLNISYTRIEQDGCVLDEKTDICFSPLASGTTENSFCSDQSSYDHLFKQLGPDMVVLFGSRAGTYAAAIAASRNAIPIAHIQGGESDFRVWDDSYGYGITKLSHLHFTSTEKYRGQVIHFGEHPERVFNVGSLLVEKIKSLPMEEKANFKKNLGLAETDVYILVSFRPEMALGSKNSDLFREILNSLADPRLENVKIIFDNPDPAGFGRMIHQMTDAFTMAHAHRSLSASFTDLARKSAAIRYGAAVVGNSAEITVVSSCFKTPMVNIGTRLQDKAKAANMIESRSSKEAIVCAIQNGLSAAFKESVQEMRSPFAQESSARKIKEMIQSFTRMDIREKSYY